MRPLTTTSYGLLALLNLQPWSGYDLANQMGRSLRYVWPRAVSAIYEEPKNLTAHGLATARTERQGRRTRTVYAITPKGRRALARWLGETSAPPRFESEALVRISFPDAGTPATTRATLGELLVQMESLRAQLETQVGSYLEPDHGPFPQRLHVIALDARFVAEYVAMLQRWARWAITEVERWPSTRQADVPAALESISRTHGLLRAGAGGRAAGGGPVTVREASVAEFPALAGLILESYAEFAQPLGSAVWEWYREDLADVASRHGPGVTLVAQRGSELVGTVAYRPPRRGRGRRGGPPAGGAEIRVLAVPPPRRRTGVATALLQACLERARADGAAALWLTTHPLMRAAQALYARLGFAHAGQEILQGGGVRLERFVLELRPPAS